MSCGRRSRPVGFAPRALRGNVLRRQQEAGQKNRRTSRWSSTCRPPIAASASRRSYRLWTRPDSVPHFGHAAVAALALASTSSNPAATAISSTITPARCGSRTPRSTEPGHDKKTSPCDNGNTDSWENSRLRLRFLACLLAWDSERRVPSVWPVRLVSGWGPDIRLAGVGPLAAYPFGFESALSRAGRSLDPRLEFSPEVASGNGAAWRSRLAGAS